MANSCIYVPRVNGDPSKPSILYREFMEKVGGDRPFTNLIYAHYIQDGVAEAMDAQGYKRDKFGQHKANDVYKFFDVAKIRSESAVSAQAISRTYGVMDATGNLVDFDRQTAYTKAKDINSNMKGKVAYVQQHGDKFNVIIENRDSRTHYRAAELELQELRWQAVDTAFRAAGIDLAMLEKDFPADINPLTINTYLMYLKSLAEAPSVRPFSKKDINTILHIAQNSPKIQALMSRGWGNLEETAAKAFDVLNNKTYTKALRDFVIDALNEGRTIQEATVSDLRNHLRDVVDPSFEMTSKEFDIKETLRELNEKYGISTEIMILNADRIDKLSEAAGHAIQVLNRKLNKLVSEQKGHSTEADDLRKQMDSLAKEIAGKRYFAGLTGFLANALKEAQSIQNKIGSLPTTGTRLEYAARRADLLAEAKEVSDSYYMIVKALTNLDSLIVDENINDTDKAKLKDTAEKVIKILNSQEQVLSALREDTMIDLCTEVFGDSVVEGKAVAEIVTMTKADSSIMDYLYSIGRQSNPLIGAMGTVIREAQITRDKILGEYSLRMRRADNELKKAGHTSEYIYEAVGDRGTYYIQSQIDWNKYNKAKARQRINLEKQGIKGFQLRDAMDAWIESNTEPDSTYGTNQRFPKLSKYGKKENFRANWDAAQNQYYDTMMQIKAEIDSMLPAYAQQLYRPPQLRASWLDIIKKGMDGKMTLKQVVRNLLDRMNPIKIREDDTQYGQMFVNGEEYYNGEGDFSGSVMRKIPVFYTQRLKDQNDLLLDFSGALSSWAHTAINYDTMFKIKNIVDLMADYIKSKHPLAKKDGVVQAEMVENRAIHVMSLLKDKASAFGVNHLVDGFLDKHMYGIEMKSQGKGWRILQALVNYTSLNQLAPNLKGAISNFLVGEHQMLIDSIAGSVRKRFGGDAMYSLSDYVAANALMFGTKVQQGTLMDHLTNDVNSLAHLLNERFDPLQEIAQEMGGKRYYNSPFRQMIGGFNAMGMYSMGEAAIHYVNMYAVLLHEKVLDENGKKVSLYKAFKRSDSTSGNRTLEIKSGYKMLDGHDITEAYLDEVKDKIRYINQNTHGSMNTEDKGLIHQHMAGRAVMNFRQWMVEHYSRRYRGRHWDASQHQFVEGYFNTVYKLAQSYISDYIGFVNDAHCHWNELDNAQKENVFRAIAEVSLLACLYGLSHALGDPDDHKKEFWYRMWIYQVKRLILDEEASTPWGIPKEGVTLIDSPVASVKTINGILYPVTGLIQGDAGKTLQSGRYKGWNKYGRNLLKNAPFYNQIDQLLHMDEESYVFSVFDR